MSPAIGSDEPRPSVEAATSEASLVLDLLAASRDEPGRPGAGVRDLLARAGVAGAEAEAVVETVRESQLRGARLRRRANELEALFSTARELVRLQDVDEVLGRLVERAHQLMGTDVTYLSEVENAGGDLRVRHSVGTVTPGFRDLAVPAGVGLASLVTGTREPAWVARYEAMTEVGHDDRIDAAVRAEGLVSFLGVPLAVGDEVLGALFACNRFGYDYTPDDILLLSAFADHAAAVLHTARALAERAAAVVRAEEAYRELERHLAATELASGIHEELTSAAMSGGTVVDLVATLAQRLGRRVWALDDQARLLDGGGELPSRPVLRDAVGRSQLSGHAELVEAGVRRWLVVAIVGADRVLGSIVAEAGSGPDDSVLRRTLERASQVAALVSFKRDAVIALRAERRARWLLAVVDGTDDDRSADVEPALRAMTPEACAVVDVLERDVADAALVAASAVGDHGVVARRDHRVIVAWSVEDPVADTERLRRLLADRLNESALTAVVCTGLGGWAELGPAVERATDDLRLLRPLGIEAATVPSDGLAPYHALTSGEPTAVIRFVDELLGPILDWDERRGTALFDTLAGFFDDGESRHAVARRLRIHPNTVQQRLDRIRSLLVGDWDDSEYRFRVQAAARLERLRRSLRDAHPAG
ncbi:GAF domain-containing protein [Plantibacter sp. MCCC 1A11337]|uniref:helix-turn-helix domain-containing protein n=1 Tax=Plantibacter TaxID=190323 RepID=UPI001581D7C6|nr:MULTISPECIES: GAF domain-containing protein [unclassified Plantibacter]NUJ90054.1 GAF domain-containing protein [Plantibacter sp. MCCC 1A11337]